MARPRITMNEAQQNDIFAVECCGGCGRDSGKLYILLRGMYAGTRYCRSCALEILQEREWEE